MMDRSIAGLSLLFFSTVVVSSCGDGAAPVDYDARPVWLWDAGLPDAAWPIDAPPSDACPYTMCDYTCTDVSSDPQHCGNCDKECSPAAGCSENDCSCPDGFIPATVTEGAQPASFNTDNLPLVSLRASFTGTDELAHQLRLTWDSTTTETGVDIDLNAVTGLVRISYNRSFVGPRGTFVPSAGTLQFSRLCNDGVAGTMTDVTLVEVSGGPGGGTEIPDGCSLDFAAIAFDFGSDCAPE